MINRYTGIVILPLMLVSLVCTAADKAKSAATEFKVPRDSLMLDVHTIGVLPLEVADVVPDPVAVSSRYESEIVTRLQAAGFTVVPPAVMRDIRERLKQTLGGLYDPMTGVAVADKVKAYEDYSMNEYLARNKVDAVMRTGIVLKRAPTSPSTAEWDGVQENITGRTGLAAFMTSVSVSGYTPALSFVVNLSDMYGKTLYEKAGGLQILGYLRAEGFSVKLRQVDPQFIMAAPERDSRALAIALDPLVSGSNSDPKSKVELAPADIPEDLPALRISRDELFRSYSRIVIAPVELAPIEQATSVQQRYAQLLREKLMAAGMTVVGGDEYGPLWEAARISAGGFFDSYTGRKDDGRFNEARNQVFAKLHEQHGATAYVLPAIITRRATFQTGSAHWDGVKELATTSKSWAGTMMNPSARAVGEMNVQSIRVQIVDGTGRLLFEESGGIHVTERVANGRLIPVPEPELFSDPSRDVRAVDIALKPLLPGQDSKR